MSNLVLDKIRFALKEKEQKLYNIWQPFINYFNDSISNRSSQIDSLKINQQHRVDAFKIIIIIIIIIFILSFTQLLVTLNLYVFCRTQKRYIEKRW